jgi:hypothetical protein
MSSKQSIEIHTVTLSKNRQCIGGCQNQGKWRYVTKHFICEDCKQLPEWQLKTRSRILNEYDITWPELLEGHQTKRLQVFWGKNPHHCKYRSCKLYYVSEIEDFITYIRNR